MKFASKQCTNLKITATVTFSHGCKFFEINIFVNFLFGQECPQDQLSALLSWKPNHDSIQCDKEEQIFSI